MIRTALFPKAFALALFVLALGAQPRAQTAERGLAVRPVSELPAKAKRWALVIGVDQYRDKQIGQLGGAANDARSLADALVRYAGFPADQVILLATDQPEERQPTRVNILRRLSNLASVVPKDGLLLFSFAGHGMERGGQAYLLPSDAQVSEDPTFLEDTAIGVARMRERIKAAGARQVLILLDACRNDPGGRADAPNPLTPAYVKGFDFDVRNSEVQAFATLYATDVGQRAYEYSEKKQGYFTWAVVEGLKGGAANERGEVTLSSLVNYVQGLVPKRIGVDLGRGRQQRPFAVVEGYKAEDLVIAITGNNVTVTVNTTPGAPAAPDPATIELSYWETIKNSADPEDFKSYLEKYPEGQFADLARRRAGQPKTASQPSSTSAETPGATLPAALNSGGAANAAAAAQHITAGDKLLKEGRWPEAEAEYRLAVQNDPGSARWRNKLGFALQVGQKYQEAEAEYRKSLQLEPNDAEARYGVGRALREQKKYAEAEAELREAIRLEPNRAIFHAALGKAFGDQQKWAEAEAELRQSIRLDSTIAEVHTILGWVLSAQQKYAAAETEVREALRLEPNNAWHRSQLGFILAYQKKYSEAEAVFREAVRLQPKVADFYRELGRILYYQGKHSEAEGVLREAVRLNPKDSDSHYNLGYILGDQKKYSEAEAEFREAVRLMPGVAHYHYGLGCILTFQYRYPEAEAVLREAVRLDPKNALYRGQLGMLLAQRGKYAEAEAEGLEAVRLEPNSVVAHNHLGVILEMQKKWAEAEAQYRVAARLDPTNPAMQENLKRVSKQRK